jgi:ADP-L-glycero-D-manno-heptose 6-epimerase
MSKIIVTGGAGFIGSNLISALNAIGHDDIIVVDHFADADLFLNLTGQAFSDLIDAGRFIDSLADFGEIEAVFHLGAISSTTEKDGRALLENNIQYSKKLLDWCLVRRIPFIYASSASVYGDGTKGFHDDDRAAEQPINGYAFTKWAIDIQVRKILAQGRAESQIVGLRYFNVYGRNEWHKGPMSSPMLHFHRQAVASQQIKVFAGSERYRRDFIAVEDCCAVNLHFLANRQSSGIFNCGSGSATSFLDVANSMLPYYPDARIVEVPFPAHLKGKYQEYTCADLTRLRAAGCELRFKPAAQGIADYVRILQSSPADLRL